MTYCCPRIRQPTVCWKLAAPASSPSRLSEQRSLGGRDGHFTPTALQLLFFSTLRTTDWMLVLLKMKMSYQLWNPAYFRTKTRRLTSCVGFAVMKCAELTLSSEQLVVCQSIRRYIKIRFWMSTIFPFVVFVVMCHCVCASGLIADLGRPSAEVHYISTVAVPEFGLCPHALSLHHCPGGHVFPGHRALFPGWQR